MDRLSLLKAIIYFTETYTLVESEKLFCEDCVEYKINKKCSKGIFCDKFHKGCAQQNMVKDVLCVIRNWDKLSQTSELSLYKRVCDYQNECKNKSCCRFIHHNDIVQRCAIELRYHYNISFCWNFVW